MARTRKPRESSVAVAAIELLAKRDPELVRERVVVAGEDNFCRGLVDALKPRKACVSCGQKAGWNRWAFTLYAHVSKLVGVSQAVEDLIKKQLGAPVADATRALDVWRGVEAMDTDQVAAEAEDFLRRYYETRGKRLLIVDARKQLPA